MAVASPVYNATYLGNFRGYAINNSGQVAGTGALDGESIAVRASIGSVEYVPGMGGAALDINSSGTLAGYTRWPEDPDDIAAAVGHSALTPLATELHTQVAARINDSGVVLLSGAAGVTIWNGTTMTNLGAARGPYFEFTGDINNSGHVTGAVEGSAFLWNGSSLQLLGFLPDGTSSRGTAINELDQIAGYADYGGAFQAFLYSGGVMQGLGSLGSFSIGMGLNLGGDVTGLSDTGSQIHAFVYRNGVMYDLNSLLTTDLPEGVFLREAPGINDSGAIVAVAYSDTWNYYGTYLLTPSDAPEPATSALLAGALIFGWYAARRRTARP